LRVKKTFTSVLEKEKQPINGRALVFLYSVLYEENLNEIFTGQKYGPVKLTSFEKEFSKLSNENINECFGITDNIPDFLTAEFKRSLGRNFRNAMRLLERRAPISIRVNPLRSDISSILECLSLEGIEGKKSKTVRYGINITGNPRRLTQIQAFKDGCFEVQDLHSQKIIEDLPVNEHAKVLDYCAGAGGKILSIACSLNGNGKFYIHDIDKRKLKEADLRAKRAGVKFKRLEVENLQKYCYSFDSVIADVPCSGSGAWRRNPQQKWRITPESLNEILIRQTIILNEVKDLIKKNGYIFYITCSVLKIENEEVIYKFLMENKHFRLLNKKDVAIDNHGDGFFCAVLQKKN
jgi:16S rRNA (cytosine967-C5)-methyltransferase